jgi:phosphate transport system permease protein
MTKQSFKENFMKVVFIISALASILAVALICLFLFANGVPAIAKIGPLNFLLGREWSPTDIPPLFGILPMIIGSI